MLPIGTLAAMVGGRVVGDANRQIRDVADLVHAGPEHLSFLSNNKYREQFEKTRAAAVLVGGDITEASHTTLIICDDPYLALARIAQELHPLPSWPCGVESGAHVHPEARLDPTATVRVGAVVERGARIGARTLVGPGSYVGLNVRLGDDVLLHPGVKVLDRCVVGHRCILHAGVVIGSDGFGYAPETTGHRHKIPQVGIVQLDDDVEVGANTTVDRATFGATRIGAGTKIDNLVQIAHNVVTGRDCVIVSQSGIAGSTTLGDRVIMGAQGGIVGHVKIADDVMLGARAGVPNNLPEAGVFSGTPAMPHRLWLKAATAQKSLPEMRARLRKLERIIETLKQRVLG